ncbi:MAG: MerR family transcriptional regulator, partial [Sciscionella sp.]
LQRTRAELGLILAQATPTDLPPEIAPAATDPEMSEAGRSCITVMTRVLGPRGLRAYADMLGSHPTDPVGAEFSELPADADETRRTALAERMAPFILGLYTDHPDLNTMASDAPRGGQFAAETVEKAMKDLLNTAQLDVLRRVQRLLAAPSRSDSTPGEAERT